MVPAIIVLAVNHLVNAIMLMVDSVGIIVWFIVICIIGTLSPTKWREGAEGVICIIGRTGDKGVIWIIGNNVIIFIQTN